MWFRDIVADVPHTNDKLLHAWQYSLMEGSPCSVEDGMRIFIGGEQVLDGDMEGILILVIHDGETKNVIGCRGKERSLDSAVGLHHRGWLGRGADPSMCAISLTLLHKVRKKLDHREEFGFFS
jgi:hypothetical protein